MWFILVLFCAYLYISASVIAADDTCQGKYCAAHTNQRTFEPRGESLKLVSTGRRAKNLFVTTVDVYSVGVYISSDKERSLRKTKEVKFDVELSKSTIEKACLGVVLTFARDIGKSSIVDALKL